MQHHEEDIRHIWARQPTVYETNIQCVSIYDLQAPLDSTPCALSQISERQCSWRGHDVSPHKEDIRREVRKIIQECTNKC